MRPWIPALAAALLLPVQGLTAEAASQDDGTEPLFLQVFVNGYDREVITRVEGRDAELRMDAGDLIALGIREEHLPGGGLILLRGIPGIGYRYDALAQRLDLTVAAALLTPQLLGTGQEETPEPRADPGMSLNYSLYVQSDHDRSEADVALRGISRIDSGFGRMPVLRQDDIARAKAQRTATANIGSNLRFFGPFGLMASNGHTTVESGTAEFIRDDT